MTDNWDSYLCEINQRPASILVDLGIVSQAPLPQFPCMGYVNIALKHPDENGFPRREEYETLIVVEDTLEAALTAQGGAAYVGRCATEGRHDLIFYTTGTAGWDAKVAAAMQAFPSYEWDTGAHLEPEWETYLNFLYPDDNDMLAIQNRRVCRRLLEQGDDLSKSRPVDHWLAFPAHALALAFCDEARAQGYKVEEAAPEAQEDGEGSAPIFRVRLSRSDAPDDIDEITFALFGLARKHEGAYDGWGCATSL